MKIVSLLSMDRQFITDLKLILNSTQKVVIIPHKNPDGDALGSALAWMCFLRKKKHDVVIISPNDYPDFLKWLPGENSIVKHTIHPKEVRAKIEQASLIFTLDFNILSRCGDLEPLVKKSCAHKIMIDHHENPDSYAFLKYSDPKMSSTSEMIYHLINSLDKNLFSPEIAKCLYTGIMTDTGSFRYPSTTSLTHRAIAHLVEEGADGDQIHQKIYDSSSFSRLKLLGITLSNMTQIKDLPIVYLTLSQEELNSCVYKKGDTEGFVNYGLSLDGIIFSCIMIENEINGIIKMSFRSQGDFSVNDFARTYFNGGGHHNAAGGMSELNLQETILNFKKAVREIENNF